MKILIYGGGAVGLGIASCLLKAQGAEIDIVSRTETAERLKKDGLIRSGIFGEYHAASGTFGSYASLEAISEKVYDFILVCTKSFDSDAASDDLSKHPVLWNEKTSIVLFQNGWGNAEMFERYFSQKQIYNARVITGFRRAQKNAVEITVHADAIHLGSLFKENISVLENLSRMITAGGIPCEVTQQIEKDLWAKMLYNCALNPLGAIFQVPYGVLGEGEHSRKIMRQIVAEVFTVMNAAGYSTHWETAEAYLKVFYEQQLPSTAAHESSTLQDLRAKKRTEIDFLSGAVVRLAQKDKIDVPTNLLLYNMVKFIEARNISVD